MMLATRASVGQSTSATESKNAFKAINRSTDTGATSGGGHNRQFDFGKLVNSIMSNPFQTSGLNSQA